MNWFVWLALGWLAVLGVGLAIVNASGRQRCRVGDHDPHEGRCLRCKAITS